MPKFDPRVAFKRDMGHRVSVGQFVATWNSFHDPRDASSERSFVGRVVSIQGKVARLSMLNVGRGGVCTYARGAPLRFHKRACWPVPVGAGGAGMRLLLVDPEDAVVVQKKQQKLKPVDETKSSLGFKSANPVVKDAVNSYLASLLESGGGGGALVLDTATLASSKALLKKGILKRVFVPNHDATEVARMPAKRPNVTVRHCSAREMLEDGLDDDGHMSLQLAFLDYCGAWDESKLGDVIMLLPRLAKRAVVALTICRRTGAPPDGGFTMEDLMRRDFERAVSCGGYAHVCLRTFRYAGAMLTCVYELRR